MGKVVLGIDIGGTNTEIGVVNKEGKILDREHLPTMTNCNVDDYIKALVSKMKSLIDRQAMDTTIIAVGIGAPNGNYYKGSIEDAVNLGWGKSVPFIDLLKTYFPKYEFALTNDANAAAVGEMIFGGAKMMKDFIMLTLGTGVGSGIVINGNLVLGHDGFAAELGHTTAIEGGRECGCGNFGCLETYCSATGIVKTISELIAASRTESALRDIPPTKLTSKDIYDAAEAGDEIALEAFEITGELLGKAMANMVAFSSPEAFFLFGGLAQAGNYIFDPTKKYLKLYQRSIYSREIKVLPSQLKGASIAIMGAAALAFQELKN